MVDFWGQKKPHPTNQKLNSWSPVVWPLPTIQLPIDLSYKSNNWTSEPIKIGRMCSQTVKSTHTHIYIVKLGSPKIISFDIK